MFPHPPQCATCGRPLARPGYPPLCGDWQCAVKFWRAERPRQRELRRRAEEERAQWREAVRARRDAAAAAAGILDPDSIPPITVPALCRPLVPLPPERQEAFLVHLRHTVELLRAAEDVAEAAGRANEPSDATPCAAEVHRLVAAACALCGGYCCRCGAEHAYVNETTLRRHLQANGGAGPEEALAAYAARVPENSYESSCVFHAAHGCSLPRTMRSDTCNGFECMALAALIAQLGRSPGLRVFLVAEDHGKIAGSCLAAEGRRE